MLKAMSSKGKKELQDEKVQYSRRGGGGVQSSALQGSAWVPPKAQSEAELEGTKKKRRKPTPNSEPPLALLAPMEE